MSVRDAPTQSTNHPYPEAIPPTLVAHLAEHLGVAPLDAYNTALLEHVHPPAWVNPTPKDRYHLVVVGAGTGGLVTAAIAAGLGARVALIERRLMGGDCLNVGCVPSKALIRAARSWHEASTSAAMFGGPRVGDPRSGDFSAAMERMRRVRAELSEIDGAPRYASLGVDVFLGSATFTAPDAIEIDGARLRFRRAVVATGARAAMPSVEGLTNMGFYTNETIFNLTTRPERLLVVGGGPIGCELAQTFARLGSRVTVLQSAARILPRDEADAAAVVHRAMERDGVTIITSAMVTRAQQIGSETVLHYTIAGPPAGGMNAGGMNAAPTTTTAGVPHSVAGDAILVAAGRAPNVEGLGLEAAGIAFTPQGITVDDHLRNTTNARVYAIGDVASRYHFTHVADAQARLVVQNALFFGRKKASALVIPWCTYTTPELAHVGHTRESAAAAGIRVDTVTVPLTSVDRAVLDGEAEGFLSVHTRRGTDRIVGATLVAEHAGESISELTVAITNGVGLTRVGAAIHPYPTQAEAIRKAADAWRRRKLTPMAKRVFGLFFRIVR